MAIDQTQPNVNDLSNSPIYEFGTDAFSIERFFVAPDILLQVTQWRNTGHYRFETFNTSGGTWSLIDSYENTQSMVFGWGDTPRYFSGLNKLELPFSLNGNDAFATWEITDSGHIETTGDYPNFGAAGGSRNVAPNSLQEVDALYDGYYDSESQILYQYNGGYTFYGDAPEIVAYDLAVLQGDLLYGEIIASNSFPKLGLGDTQKFNPQMTVVGETLFASFEKNSTNATERTSVLLALDKSSLTQTNSLRLEDAWITGIISNQDSVYVLTMNTVGAYSDRQCFVSKYGLDLTLDSSFGDGGTVNVSEALGITDWHFIRGVVANDLDVVTVEVVENNSSKLVAVDFLGFVEDIPGTQSTGRNAYTEMLEPDMVVVTERVDRADGSVILQSSIVDGLDLSTLNTAFDEYAVSDGDDVAVSDRSLIDVGSESLVSGSDDVDVINLFGDSSIIQGNGGDDRINVEQSTNSYVDGGDGDDQIRVDLESRWVRDDVVAMNVSGIGVATGKTVSLNGAYGQSTAIINGGQGTDTVTFGAEDDAIAMHDFFSSVNETAKLNNLIGDVSRDPRFVNVEIINGGAGNDLMDFSSIAFRQNGLTLQGGDGDDIIWGGDLEDVIEGGSGNDVINGGAGNDVLTGGSGVDRFEFTITSGNDVITDFVKGEDKLEFYLRDGFGEDEVDAIPTLAGNAVLIGEYQVDINVQGGTLDESDYTIFWI